MPWPVDIPADPTQRLLFHSSVAATLCAAAVLGAVLLNFLTASHGARHERRSPVATSSMLAFAALFAVLVRRHWGMLPLPAYSVHLALTAAGLALMLAGAAVNLLGRLALGRNWANQVTIYAEQTLVTTGVYGLVRHPLYASLIWLFTGIAVAYLNWAALLATLLVFVPMMIYRARLEETALAERFTDYAAYQRRVGRLFPKIGGGR